MPLETICHRMLLVCFAVACVACLAVRAAPPVEAPRYPVKLEAEHLPNVVLITPKVISGGLPEGEAGFAELEKLGVKTVIDVDGIKPDVAAARRHGMRYVHLPHGYDGIPPDRIVQLAKAVRELPGPIYIHCHHGKHRSPAAATAACVTAGFMKPDLADDVLKLAGTGRNYIGLFHAAESARPMDPMELDRKTSHFVEIAPLPAMAEAMVEIDLSFDRMKQIAAAGWKTPPDHPDLEPAHEALILREQFTELLRSDEVQQRPGDFRALLAHAEQLGEALDDALRADRSNESLARANAILKNLAANCAACHRIHRDVPHGT